ncbi:MAG: tRNA pseudouridine(38-40) synthase TruA [Planctomycetota bacterium]
MPPDPGERPEKNVKLVVEYDGTAYEGWQSQASGNTVQDALGRAILALTGERSTVYGAGRTDAGVHALGQVANFRTRTTVPTERVPLALNAHLPDDVSVVSAEEVPAGFHAQFSAKGKTYRYVVACRRSRPALDRNRVYWWRTELDLEGMKAAAVCLVGEHDFRAFGTETAGKENTVRRIDRLDIDFRRPYIDFTVRGNGFLYNMVRSLVGTLLLVGKGGLAPAAVKEILESRDRRKAGPVAPAKGLTLVEVHYE